MPELRLGGRVIPQLTAEEVRRHIAYKRDGERTLAPEVAERMLAALDAGAATDYQALWRAAAWPTPPPIVYHTAPASARASIMAEGLRVGVPAEGNWSRLACEVGQPAGVYVEAKPDRAGKWSHWPEHDVWAIDREGLAMEPDELNPGCWVILEPVDRMRLGRLSWTDE